MPADCLPRGATPVSKALSGGVDEGPDGLPLSMTIQVELWVPVAISPWPGGGGLEPSGCTLPEAQWGMVPACGALTYISMKKQSQASWSLSHFLLGG